MHRPGRFLVVLLVGWFGWIIFIDQTATDLQVGKDLFHSKDLSKGQAISCTSCHMADFAMGSNLPLDGHIHGTTNRNTPPLFNLSSKPQFFWDGGIRSLNQVHLAPLLTEMDFLESPYFQEHKDPYILEKVTRALSRYLLSLEVKANHSPFRYSSQGKRLFLDKCIQCHTPPTMTNYGLYKKDIPSSDSGHFRISGRPEDLGKMVVPSLLEIEKTAPYFHNGYTYSLEEAIGLCSSDSLNKEQIHALSLFLQEL